MTATVVQLAPKAKEAQARLALKERFVRVPSRTALASYRDLVTGIVQSDPFLLLTYYRKHGGTELKLGDNLPLTVVMGEGFQPLGQTILEGDLLNLWQPPKLQPSGEKVTREQGAPFLEFLTRWFPDSEERAYFTRWMAWTVRHPHRRIIVSPLLRSEHGIGKGFFVECLMAGLLGKKSVANTGLKSVVGDFNEVLEGKTFIVIDELYRNGETTANALKSIQGNGTFTLNRKHQPIVTVDNFVNFIVTSNDLVPLDLEAEDRRFWVPQFIKHKVDSNETSSFINGELRPWLEAGGFQVVRDYLEQISLSGFYPTNPAPMTQSKKDMIGFSPREELAEFVTEYIDDVQVLKAADIESAYRQATESDVSTHAISKELAKLGCKQKRTNLGRWWITPKGQAAGLSETSTPADMQKAYAA
jgi:hypothetical protein